MKRILILNFLLGICAACPIYAQEVILPQPADGNLFTHTSEVLDRLGSPIPIAGDSVRLTMRGEVRYRFELRDNFNFNSTAFNDDGVNLFRSRLGAKLTLGPNVTIFAQGQDSESIAGNGANRTSSFVNRFDVHQLYVKAKSPWERLPVTIKVGRQELNYGDQRFVGAFNWSNVARVFDAAKLIYRPADHVQVDLWFSQVVPVNRSQADSALHDENFWGVYVATKPVKNQAFDTFLFIRHNKDNEIAGERPGQLGQLKEYTAGNRLKGKIGHADYGVEWAYQFGSRAHNLIQAWALHNQLGYTLAGLPASPHIEVEYNHGSGDDNASDGRFNNFDNLFPTNHIHYGYIDFASLRNMNDIKIGVDAKPDSALKLIFAYHWFFLSTNKSAFFNAGQKVIRPATPGASTTVGQELDLAAKWKLSPHVHLLAGYSHFHAGAFLADSGTSDNANFVYLQPVISF